MDKRKIGLSVVIPCFNEVENIVLLLKELKEIFLTSKYNIEVIIVDGCSTDDTHLFLKEEFRNLDKNIFSLILMENQNGYGNDILEGLKKARYEYLCWTHADLQTDPNDVIRGLEIIDSHADMDSRIKDNFPGQFGLSAVSFGSEPDVTHLLTVGFSSMAELESWEDSVATNGPVQHFLEEMDDLVTWTGSGVLFNARVYDSASDLEQFVTKDFEE